MRWRKYYIPAFISISFIAAFLVLHYFERRVVIQKEITYSPGVAGEAYVVWGIDNLPIPDSGLWPKGSFLKKGVIYTRMNRREGTYEAILNVYACSQIYYWIWMDKDEHGNVIDKWYSGTEDRLTAYVDNPSWFKSGYLLLLAGALPLLMIMLPGAGLHFTPRIQKAYTINNSYVKEFDGLRAIAVLLVIIHHWVPEKSLLNITPNGPLGVTIFFVLSGYLITGILLKQKIKNEMGLLTKPRILKNFIIRRSLRIFPIYFLFVGLLYFLNDTEVRQHILYYLTYTSNYLFYKNEFWSTNLAHTWSLSVEEQFYLFWPFCILFTPRKYLPYLIFFCITIGISFNYIVTEHSWWVGILTPGCMDAFGLGALFSYIIVFRNDCIYSFLRVLRWATYSALLLMILKMFNYSFLPDRTVHSVLALSLLCPCVLQTLPVIMRSILNNPILVFLGKISYGIYLYHLMIPSVWKWIIDKFSSWNFDLFFNAKTPAILQPSWIFLQQFMFLILICYLSWKFIEYPINKLKEKFA